MKLLTLLRELVGQRFVLLLDPKFMAYSWIE